MKAKLGDLSDNLSALRGIRDQLIVEDDHYVVEAARCERWLSFGTVSKKIHEACEDRDLEGLVGAVREMKNRLRRPAVRKELLRWEKFGDDKGKAEGDCKCAQCNTTIDGSHDPCVQDALCTKCALSKKTSKKDDPRKEPKDKGGDKNKVDTGKSVRDREAEQDSGDDAKRLRKRKYNGEK